MTDEAMLDSVAINPIVGKEKEDIREQFNYAKKLVLRTMHRLIKGYWRKENSHFTLSSGATSVNLGTYFSDIDEVKYFWLIPSGTGTGKIDIKSEKWFRNTFPQATDTGEPVYAVWLTDNTFRFYPTPDSDMTIYLSYLFIPDFSSITSFPEKFSDIIEYGILSFFEDAPSPTNNYTKGKYTMLYHNMLEKLDVDPAPTPEWEPELIFGEGQEDINDAMDSLERI